LEILDLFGVLDLKGVDYR